jgi:hypothetical protein
VIISIYSENSDEFFIVAGGFYHVTGNCSPDARIR